MSNDKEYLTIQEVAGKLRVAYLTVYRWIKAGKLEALKAGRQYRISKPQLDRFLKINIKHKQNGSSKI